jgi:hypothetical protein
MVGGQEKRGEIGVAGERQVAGKVPAGAEGSCPWRRCRPPLEERRFLLNVHQHPGKRQTPGQHRAETDEPDSELGGKPRALLISQHGKGLEAVPGGVSQRGLVDSGHDNLQRRRDCGKVPGTFGEYAIPLR